MASSVFAPGAAVSAMPTAGAFESQNWVRSSMRARAHRARSLRSRWHASGDSGEAPGEHR